ncbi:MAG: small ribosomal subunit Rsm22 family protein [Clostridiales bacterium]|nr:small ribosomal subunit Rsm22 family protein [Clostridiales bacterium]
MDLPSTLKAAIEGKCAAWRHNDLLAAAQGISERYRKESGHGKSLLNREVEALAYATVRMPATFAAVSAALGSTLPCFVGEIHTVLDVGAGTGAATWAVRMQVEDAVFTCLEREVVMMSLGAELMQEDAVLSRTAWIRHDLAASPVTQRADLVMASYVLNEMDAPGRQRVLQQLWACTDKLLLLVEPGTPVGYGQLREARSELIRLGGHVVAPCVHDGACPLPAEDWCQFTSRVARSRLHKQFKGGDAPFEDEKFSYLAVAKCGGKPAQSRILRHPRKESGRIVLRLCTREGIFDRAVTRRDGELFKAARKAGSGDAFPLAENPAGKD